MTENVNAALSTESANEIGDKIISALERVKVSYGFNIVRGEYGVRKADRNVFYPAPDPLIFWCADMKNIDVCGALAIVYQRNESSAYEAARAALGVSDEFMRGLIHGWDMEDPSMNESLEDFHSPLYIQGYWTGANISKEYLRDHVNETIE